MLKLTYNVNIMPNVNIKKKRSFQVSRLALCHALTVEPHKKWNPSIRPFFASISIWLFRKHNLIQTLFFFLAQQNPWQCDLSCCWKECLWFPLTVNRCRPTVFDGGSCSLSPARWAPTQGRACWTRVCVGYRSGRYILTRYKTCTKYSSTAVVLDIIPTKSQTSQNSTVIIVSFLSKQSDSDQTNISALPLQELKGGKAYAKVNWSHTPATPPPYFDTTFRSPTFTVIIHIDVESP